MSKQQDTQKIADQIINEQNQQTRDKEYNKYVKQMTPKFNWFTNLVKAFIIGGLICMLGQALVNCYQSMGADKELAKSYCTLTLILLSVITTGFGWYSSLTKFAGAGSVVPITGFANSVAASAIEFKKEGQVFGIGCKIFVIAGPVILYGIFSSWLFGLIHWLLKVAKVI